MSRELRKVVGITDSSLLVAGDTERLDLYVNEHGTIMALTKSQAVSHQRLFGLQPTSIYDQAQPQPKITPGMPGPTGPRGNPFSDTPGANGPGPPTPQPQPPTEQLRLDDYQQGRF